MVLGMGSRKLRKKGSDVTEPAKVIRPSPSLPELKAQGIAWPQNLVDVSVIYGDGKQRSGPTDPPASNGTRAAKTSFAYEEDRPVPFHRPFRRMSNAGQPQAVTDAPISSLYMSKSISSPPSAFEAQTGVSKRPISTVAPTFRARSLRKARAAPPTFNLMVAGGRGSGKTSLLRLLLDTADISPVASPEQRLALERLFNGETRHTRSIQAISMEIVESKLDRVLLTVIDTPGLDFRDAHELKLERQVSDIVRYLDNQFADTMGEESKVVRTNKGDQHVHLCIYLIDPSSIMYPSARAALSSFPLRPRAQSTSSRHARARSNASIRSVARDGEDERDEALTMSPAEIKILRRLAARVNVLPIIARADSLTDEALVAVKDAVRRDLIEAGLGFGLFEPPKPIPEDAAEVVSASASPAGGADESTTLEDETPAEDGERRSRGVIKLRPNRGAPARSRSRSRSRRGAVDDDQDLLLRDLRNAESVANRRFSAHIVAKANLDALMPFAVIAPEETPRQRSILAESAKHHARHANGQLHAEEPNASGMASNRSSVYMSVDGHTESMIQSPVTPSASHPPIWQTQLDSQGNPRVSLSFLLGPPRDLKGVFVRKFRWGVLDVLDPAHCDFAALRTAVFSTHMKVLKNHTKEVLYEKYRTEKLLARRATQNISEEERQRFLLSISLGPRSPPVLDQLLSTQLLGGHGESGEREKFPLPSPSPRPSMTHRPSATPSSLKAHPEYPAVFVIDKQNSS